MKKYLFIYLLLFVALTATAQQISVHAPSHVATGENFRLSYTVNTQDVEDFRAGNIPEGLDVVAGPYLSSQSSYHVVNGHTSRSSSVTYTYTVYAGKSGTYTIPSATCTAGGKKLTSAQAKVTVSGQSSGSARQSAPRMHEEEDNMRAAGSKITGNDLFIKVSASKRKVHEQEPVLLTYKVYTQVELTQLEGKMPDLTGFHTQEVPLPQQKSFHTEQINGKNYRCVTWSQYVMFPQMTGKLEIPSITFKGIVVQQNRYVDPLEAFLNGGSGYVEVKKDIVAPGLTLEVVPLPQRPQGFSGGVGHFSVKADLDKQEVKAGDPVTLRVVVSGKGNMKLIKEPVAEFPKDFDKYDAKVTDKTRLTANGSEGDMIYDILVVPRNQGDYTIPAVKFIYFDTESNAYKTVSTAPLRLHVAKGDGSQAQSSAQMTREKDIRQIMKGGGQGAAAGRFYGSKAYRAALLIPLLAFIALLIVFRKRALDNADVVKMRGKRANKVAVKRLRKAASLKSQGRQEAFYDEVLRALWGYAGDKLNMSAENLSRDNILEKLTSAGVAEADSAHFLEAIDECEFERYAPGDAAGNMNKTFDKAMTAIMGIEETMKKKKSKSRPVATALLLLCLLPLAASAQQKDSADAAYLRGNYQQAAAAYERLAETSPSAAVYYNLGNAYYRLGNIPKSVLNYERARLLKPGNKDIRFNLQFVREKTVDKITEEHELFIVPAYRALVNLMSVDAWAWTALTAIVLALALILVYLFASGIVWRKIGFFGALAGLLLFLAANWFAWQQQRTLERRDGAIVMAPKVEVVKTPAKGAEKQFELHEGTRIDITDKSIKGWYAFRLADGREGWLPAGAVEII